MAEKSPVTRMALCFIGAGSCYGNGVDQEAAVKRCWIEIRDFAKSLGGFKDPKTTEIPIHVYDYEPYDRITWGDRGVRGHVTKESEGVPIEPLATVWVNGYGKEIKTPAHAL